MSDEMIKKLEAQLKQTTEQLKAASAQVEAHKQMLGESIQSCINMRTCVIMFQQSIQEYEAKIKEKDKQITGMKQMITDLTANNAKLEEKIKELTSLEAPQQDAA